MVTYKYDEKKQPVTVALSCGDDESRTRVSIMNNNTNVSHA